MNLFRDSLCEERQFRVARAHAEDGQAFFEKPFFQTLETFHKLRRNVGCLQPFDKLLRRDFDAYRSARKINRQDEELARWVGLKKIMKSLLEAFQTLEKRGVAVRTPVGGEGRELAGHGFERGGDFDRAVRKVVDDFWSMTLQPPLDPFKALNRFIAFLHIEAERLAEPQSIADILRVVLADESTTHPGLPAFAEGSGRCRRPPLQRRGLKTRPYFFFRSPPEREL